MNLIKKIKVCSFGWNNQVTLKRTYNLISPKTFTLFSPCATPVYWLTMIFQSQKPFCQIETKISSFSYGFLRKFVQLSIFIGWAKSSVPFINHLGGYGSSKIHSFRAKDLLKKSRSIDDEKERRIFVRYARCMFLLPFFYVHVRSGLS